MRSSAFVALLAAPLFATTALGQTTDPTGARLDSALHALEAKGFSGVIRVDRDGATILEKGYGLANRAERRRFEPTTVVQIGSNTKDFTLVALLQLQARGRLDMRDSLAKYFPEATGDKRNITLAQLANHRAGFPIGLGGDFEPLGRAQFLDAAFRRPLSFTPGTREQYSNTGYSILAAVIEKVSGTTYDEYVRANILEPLGLKNTGFLLPTFDARPVRAAIAQVLGLPSDDGGRPVASTPRANAHPPTPAVAALLTDLVSVINAADSARVVRFVADHFLVEPGAPPAEQRVTRLLAMHQNLGALTLNGLDQIEPGVVEASVVTAQEGAATMKFMLDTSPSPKIKGIQMRVGG